MIKMNILDYGVYCGGNHIADFDGLEIAKFFAKKLASDREEDVIIINNFTGEVCAEFVVKFRIEIVEVEP